MTSFEEHVTGMQSEILDDVRSGIIPATVPTFSALHDFVDANEYASTAPFMMLAALQNAVHAWILDGGITGAVANLTPCKFHFDDGVLFSGHATGATWNGFDNVKVSPWTRDAIVSHLAHTHPGDPGADDVASVPVGADGLVDLSGGFATIRAPRAWQDGVDATLGTVAPTPNVCEGYSSRGRWIDCTAPMPHLHGIVADMESERNER